jgi:hypothetical protein
LSPVVALAHQLVDVARGHGYRKAEVIRMIERIS